MPSKSKTFSGFYIVILWMLSFSVYVLMYLPKLNSVATAIIIPFLFVAVLFKEKTLKINTGLFFYMLLILWGSLSLVYSPDLDLTVRYLLWLILNSICWYIVGRCVSNISNFIFLFIPFGAAFLIQLYFTLVSLASTSSVVVNDQLQRVSGLSSNENDQARILVFGIVLIILMIIYLRKYFLKIILWPTLILFFIGVFWTGSREALISILILLFIFLFLNYRKQWGYMIGITLFIFLAYNLLYDYIMANTPMGQRFQLAVEQGTGNIRFSLLKEGWNYFANHPYFGIGLGAFTSYSSSSLYSHNDYIEILSTLGLPAFLIYMCIYFDYFKKWWRIRKRVIGSQRSLFCMLLAFLVGYLCLGFFDPLFYYSSTVVIFSLFYSIIDKMYNSIIHSAATVQI